MLTDAQRADAIDRERYDLAALEREQHQVTPPPLWTCPMCNGGVPPELVRDHVSTCTGRRKP